MGLPASLVERLSILTTDEKRELTEFGITRQKRWDWQNMDRHPTAAQLRTLAVVLDLEVAPLLLWLAEQEATPQQLDLFLRALAKATAGMLVVILSGAQNDANAASMRVTDGFVSTTDTAHYAQYDPGGCPPAPHRQGRLHE